MRKLFTEAKGRRPYAITGDLENCEPCMLGKSHLEPFKSSFEEAKEVGEIIQLDLDGPLPASVHGAK